MTMKLLDSPTGTGKRWTFYCDCEFCSKSLQSVTGYSQKSSMDWLSRHSAAWVMNNGFFYCGWRCFMGKCDHLHLVNQPAGPRAIIPRFR